MRLDAGATPDEGLDSFAETPAPAVTLSGIEPCVLSDRSVGTERFLSLCATMWPGWPVNEGWPVGWKSATLTLRSRRGRRFPGAFVPVSELGPRGGAWSIGDTPPRARVIPFGRLRLSPVPSPSHRVCPRAVLFEVHNHAAPQAENSSTQARSPARRPQPATDTPGTEPARCRDRRPLRQPCRVRGAGAGPDLRGLHRRPASHRRLPASGRGHHRGDGIDGRLLDPA